MMICGWVLLNVAGLSVAEAIVVIDKKFACIMLETQHCRIDDCVALVRDRKSVV